MTAAANNNSNQTTQQQPPPPPPQQVVVAAGDTTYTKVFVGGLAWETHKETMKSYFQQFGDILEAVVITDKATGRSKGYGFVTFKEADAAMRACVDGAPMIDGRRANCNLACLGLQRSNYNTTNNKPPATTPTSIKQQGGGVRNFRVINAFQAGFQGTAFAPTSTPPAFSHYAIHQGIPYSLYGYSYTPDYSYPTSYYNVYGGASGQYPMYGAAGAAAAGGMMNAAATAFYPHVQFADGNSGATAAQSYGLQYPNHHFFPYSASAISSTAGAFPQHYAPSMSISPTSPMQSGVTMTFHAPIPHR